MTGTLPRRTLIGPAVVQGAGLFTSVPSRVSVLPAPARTGLVFRRVDVQGAPEAPANVSSLARAPEGVPARNTTLRAGAAECVTVEHVLSVLTGLGVSDAIIELNSPEVPILDGSGTPFADAIWRAGLRYGGEQVEPLRVMREVRVSDPNGSTIVARPRSAPGCLYTYELDYGRDGPIAPHAASFDTARQDYRSEIAPARTFCTLAEAEAMKKAGLFAGLSTRDMLVIGPSGPIDNAFRLNGEPARHKLLDLMGDLSLVGRPIQAEIVASKSGHALNHQLARLLLHEFGPG